ncbi:MAG: DUF3969 family protein [Enterobacteriaceae bacterium]
MDIEITTQKQENLDYFINLLIAGILSSLRNNSISIDMAEKILFSPKVASEAERIGLSAETVRNLWLGTELEDVESLLPEKLTETIDEMQNRAFSQLNSIPISNTLIDSLLVNTRKQQYELIKKHDDNIPIVLEEE